MEKMIQKMTREEIEVELATRRLTEDSTGRIEQLENDLELAKEKIVRLEEIAGWALTAELRNTASWMRGLQGVINKELVASGDARRCTFDGNELRLRNVTQCIRD